jgi:hypothetical protein
MKTPHTQTRRGKTVRVALKDGSVFEDKFVERTRKKVLVFESGRRVACGDVKSFSDRRLLQPVSSHRRA